MVIMFFYLKPSSTLRHWHLTMDSNLEPRRSGESQSSIRFRNKMHAYDGDWVFVHGRRCTRGNLKEGTGATPKQLVTLMQATSKTNKQHQSRCSNTNFQLRTLVPVFGTNVGSWYAHTKLGTLANALARLSEVARTQQLEIWPKYDAWFNLNASESEVHSPCASQNPLVDTFLLLILRPIRPGPHAAEQRGMRGLANVH